MDGRGTGGRGKRIPEVHTISNLLGVKEAKDQVEAAKHLGGLPLCGTKDASASGDELQRRLLTIMSMSEGNLPVFKAGCS